MIKEARRLAGFLTNISALIIAITIAVDLIVGARYAVDITYSLSNLTKVPEINYIPMYIFMQTIYIPIPMNITLTQLATIFISVYAALFTISIFTEQPITKLKNVITGYTGNDAIETVKIMSITLASIIIVEGIQERTGIPTGELQSPNEYIRYISALIAPFIEEVGFRLTIIGVIALIIYLLFAQANIKPTAIIKILWRPYNGKRYLNNGSYLTAIYITMVATAFLFGLSHLLAGGGWKLGKVSTATIAGLALGYLYIRHGFHSAVIGHSFFNVYLLSMYYIEKTGGVMTAIVESTYLSILILSSIYTFYIILGVEKMFKHGSLNQVY